MVGIPSITRVCSGSEDRAYRELAPVVRHHRRALATALKPPSSHASEPTRVIVRSSVGSLILAPHRASDPDMSAQEMSGAGSNSSMTAATFFSLQCFQIQTRFTRVGCSNAATRLAIGEVQISKLADSETGKREWPANRIRN